MFAIIHSMMGLSKICWHLCVVGLAVGCSTTFNPKPCSVDGDCGTGLVCELRDDAPVCVSSEDAPLMIGQSAPVSGINQALGTGMKDGIQLAFDEQNAAGGIRGRQLQLVFRDDGYDPVQAQANAMILVDAQPSTEPPKCPDTAVPVSNGAVPPVTTAVSATAINRGPNGVLAMLGDVGTPTAIRAAPVAIEANTLFFGAFTGSTTLLRDTSSGPCAKYIFNVRASYAQEARATMQYFEKMGVTNYSTLISFDQNDTFGNAGYNGLTAAYIAELGAFPGNADPVTPIARFRYIRNDDTSVPIQATAAEAYIKGLLSSMSGTITVGVMMTDTYGAGAGFITALRNWQYDGGDSTLMKTTRLNLYFSNVSFVGPNALADALSVHNAGMIPTTQLPYTTNVVVSQVVPNYQNDQSAVVQQYNALVSTNGATPGFTSLEGYISTRVFIGGLLAHDGPFTPDQLVGAFENIPDLGLGIGANAGFSPTNHQYSGSVWGTSIALDGTFKNLYFWVNNTLQFFQ